MFVSRESSDNTKSIALVNIALSGIIDVVF